jgi:TrmH family RNA methyltransferase
MREASVPPAFCYAMITSLANPKVKLVSSLQSSRRARYREGRFVVEGTRLVHDAFIAGFTPDLVLYTPGWAQSDEADALFQSIEGTVTSAFVVSDEVFEHCSDTETPQGVLALLPFPDLAPPPEPTFVVVIDRLRIPGNLGTILRTAAAAGVEAVLLPPGNIDPYNPKVVRGGMGAHFRLTILRPGWDEIRADLAHLDRWLASVAIGTRYDQVDWTRPVAIIMGGEARGAGPRAEAVATGEVHIPMPGGMESLNAAVAAGVLFFEVVRQRSLPIAGR